MKDLKKFIATTIKEYLNENVNILDDYIDINGNKYSTKNSNGDLISNDINGIVNFYKWFNDSTVVDSFGRPLVVYHETNSDFRKFDTSKIKNTNWGKGFYFRIWDEPDSGNKKIGYLSIKKPFIIKKGDFLTNVLGKQKYDTSLGDLISQERDREIIATEKVKKSYDGVYVVFKNFYVVFNPTKFKSAQNDGSFDINDDDIYS